jgi:hypothetical protein
VRRCAGPGNGPLPGVDGIDGAAGGTQGGDQEPARGLDRHGRGVFRRVTVLGEHLDQLVQATGGVVNTSTGLERACFVHDRYVVVIAGPVDAAEHFHLLQLSRLVPTFWLAKAVQGMRLPNGRARWPGIRLAVHDPSGLRGPGLDWSW